MDQQENKEPINIPQSGGVNPEQFQPQPRQPIKSNKKRNFILISLIVLILLFAVGGVAYYLGGENSHDNKEVTSLGSSVSDQKDDSSDIEYIEFKELGIKVPKKDITKGDPYDNEDYGTAAAYKVVENKEESGPDYDYVIQYSSKSYTDSVDECGGDAKNRGVFMYVNVDKPPYDARDDVRVRFVKELDDGRRLEVTYGKGLDQCDDFKEGQDGLLVPTEKTTLFYNQKDSAFDNIVFDLRRVKSL